LSEKLDFLEILQIEGVDADLASLERSPKPPLQLRVFRGRDLPWFDETLVTNVARHASGKAGPVCCVAQAIRRH
jgi:hypothetical protein